MAALLGCLSTSTLSNPLSLNTDFDMSAITQIIEPDGTASLYVVEPFIEMHTGAGRGYPIHHVIEQGQEVELLKRRTNWYKVRSSDGIEGWVKASALAHTLKPSGIPADLPDVSHSEYLASRWRVGFTTGKMEGADAYSIVLGYRPLRYVGVELEAGEVFDSSVTGSYKGGNLIIEPISRWSFTPFISFGAGVMEFDLRQKLAGEVISDADYNSIGIGTNYYLGRNFLVRGEYRVIDASSDDNDVELSEWKIGFSSFF